MLNTYSNYFYIVLCDKTMHGMKNALDTIRKIDKESPFPFKADQGLGSFSLIWYGTTYDYKKFDGHFKILYSADNGQRK